MEVYAWYAIVFGWIFMIGCAVGSFLNVVIYRLPRGKNLLWPSSRCGSCFTPIPLYHNVPLLSYWLLRGRCLHCRATFSMRYFWVELFTGLMFAGLYFLEVVLDIQQFGVWPYGGFYYLDTAQFPPHSWQVFAAHAVLGALLLAAFLCLLERGEVPRSMVVTGIVLGLAWSLLYPWPSPSQMPSEQAIGFVFWPAFAGLPRESLLTGLVTALFGILVVPWLVRVCGGREFRAVADVLSLSGAFLGWQPLLAATGLATLVTLAMGRRAAFALVIVPTLYVVWLNWGTFGPRLWPSFMDWRAGLLLAGVAVSLSTVRWVLLPGRALLQWLAWGVVLAAWTFALLRPVPESLHAVVPTALRYLASKMLHISAYAGLALAVSWLSTRWRVRLGVWAALIGHGALTEFFQNYVGRDGNLFDVGLDSCAILLGVGIGMALNRWWPMRLGGTTSFDQRSA